MKWVSQTKHAIELVVLFAKIQNQTLNGLYKVKGGLHVPVSLVLWSRGGLCGGIRMFGGIRNSSRSFVEFVEVSHSTATTLWLLLESSHMFTARFTHLGSSGFLKEQKKTTNAPSVDFSFSL